MILLARSPQDVAVSQYFQWKFRMKPGKKALNDYPPHGSNVPMADFLLGEGAGLPKIIDFMNLWAREIERVREGLILRYEDLRADPLGGFRRVVRFVEGPEDEAAIRGAVEYASVENMRRLEERRFFRWVGSMKPRDRGNPDSYKVRRAKVGGYRDYFIDEEVARIDGFVRSNLALVFGYAEPAEPSGR